MSAPTLQDAIRRALVRLPDGRTARITYVHSTGSPKSTGQLSRVVIESGAYLSVPNEHLEVIE